MTDDYIPNELELQKVYGLSIQEANVYHRKLEGQSYSDISEYLNIKEESVKQMAYNASKKIKGYDRTVDIVVNNGINQSTTRKYTALMCFYALEHDQHTERIYKGRYCMIMKGVRHSMGDMEFIRKDVFPYFNPICTNETDSINKAKELYALYLQKGGKEGELGCGFMYALATKYQIEMDVF